MIEKLNIYPDDWEKGYPRYIEQIEAKINEIIDYIDKLEKENKNLKDINQKLSNKCQERLSYSNEEIITELYTRLS